MLFFLSSFFSSLEAMLVHILLVVGIVLFFAGTFLTVIPFVKTYSLPAQILGGLLAGLGLFLEGSTWQANKEKAEIAEMQQKVKTVEAQSSKINTKIQTVTETKIQVVHDQGQTVTKYIQVNTPVMDKNCTLDTTFVKAFDDSVDIYNNVASPEKPQ